MYISNITTETSISLYSMYSWLKMPSCECLRYFITFIFFIIPTTESVVLETETLGDRGSASSSLPITSYFISDFIFSTSSHFWLLWSDQPLQRLNRSWRGRRRPASLNANVSPQVKVTSSDLTGLRSGRSLCWSWMEMWRENLEKKRLQEMMSGSRNPEDFSDEGFRAHLCLNKSSYSSFNMIS